MDNGTMVEAFKYLNYSQLAKKSLVSKRFWNLIRTNRKYLARLYVEYISMVSFRPVTAAIKVFNKELTTEAYNEWVICNNYSEQVPLQDQVTTMQSPQITPSGYKLTAIAHYKDPKHEWSDGTTVFFAKVELNREYWPAFQHFVRLLTDPFIYIDRVYLAYQIDVLDLLSGGINSDRLQCNELRSYLNGSSQKSITWTKDHVRCNHFFIYGKADPNHDEALLDFFLTGAHCTPSINIGYRILSKAIVDFVQKFMDLETSDECQLVEAIEGNTKSQVAEMFKRVYAKFIVKEERGRRYDTPIFEFVNGNIGKKLQLTVKNYGYLSEFSIKITNL